MTDGLVTWHGDEAEKTMGLVACAMLVVLTSTADAQERTARYSALSGDCTWRELEPVERTTIR